MLNNNFLKKTLLCSIFCYSLLKPVPLKKNKKIKKLAILFTTTGISIAIFLYALKNKNSIDSWYQEFFKLKNSYNNKEEPSKQLKNNENAIHTFENVDSNEQIIPTKTENEKSIDLKEHLENNEDTIHTFKNEASNEQIIPTKTENEKSINLKEPLENNEITIDTFKNENSNKQITIVNINEDFLNNKILENEAQEKYKNKKITIKKSFFEEIIEHFPVPNVTTNIYE